MHARLQIALWSIATVFGLASTHGEAALKTTTAQPAAVKPTPSVAHDLTQILSELHQAKHLLDHANHDYNGHRAKADHEIHKAIHVLHHEPKKKGATTAKPAHVKGEPKTESQQASDTQLLQAEKLVRAALLELKKHHGEKAHHASKLLHEAVREIDLAIHLHRKHHAKNAAVPAKT